MKIILHFFENFTFLLTSNNTH